jgi:ubiquitin carboxyl-terminal hydrolase 9/13
MPQPSPLEKRLKDMGPIRGDGSDKFFGMENVRLPPHSDFCRSIETVRLT